MLRYPVNPLYKSNAEELITALRRRKSDWPSAPGLQTIGPRTIDELLDIIDCEKEQLTQAQWGSTFLIVFAIVTTGFAYSRHVLYPLLPIIVLLPLIKLIPNARYRYAVYALSQTDDMRVLPTLIQATRHTWGRHPQVRAAILRLLEQVTEEHVGLLNDTAQQLLWTRGISWQTLSDNYDYEVAMGMLRALAAIGNQAMLMRFKQFAKHSERFVRDAALITLARELIPAMEARLQRQQVPATLLRASAIPMSQPDTLLRPTFATTLEPPEHLLRAAQSEAEDLSV